MSTILSKNQTVGLEEIIHSALLNAGAKHVMIVDVSGNLVLERGSMHMADIFSLAVLSAANFAATVEIARLIGEEEFTLVFHKGDKKNIHFSRLGKDHIIITLFDENVSLGLIRLKSNKAIQELETIIGGLEGKQRWPL